MSDGGVISRKRKEIPYQSKINQYEGNLFSLS